MVCMVFIGALDGCDGIWVCFLRDRGQVHSRYSHVLKQVVLYSVHLCRFESLGKLSFALLYMLYLILKLLVEFY